MFMSHFQARMRMVIYLGRLVPDSPPMEEKANIRLLIDLKELQYGKIHEVNLESVEEKTMVDCWDPFFLYTSLARNIIITTIVLDDNYLKSKIPKLWWPRRLCTLCDR